MSNYGVSGKAILTGFLYTVAMFFLLGVLMTMVVLKWSEIEHAYIYWIIIILILVSAGYITGVIAKRSEIINAAIMGMLLAFGWLAITNARNQIDSRYNYPF